MHPTCRDLRLAENLITRFNSFTWKQLKKLAWLERNPRSAKMRVLPHWDWLKSPTAPPHFVIGITDLRARRARLVH